MPVQRQAVTPDDLMDVVRLLPDVLFRCYKAPDGKIYWSLNEGGLAEAFGLTTKEIQGKSLDELFPGGASQEIRQHFEAAFEGSTEPFTNEMDGRHFRHFPQPIKDAEGNVVEVVGFISEVTELVEIQRHLEEMNRDLASFAYTVSHDLRSPLTAIANLVQLAMRRTDDQDAVEVLGQADDMIGKLSNRVEDTLALANASSGQLQRQTVDLSRMANDIHQVMQLRGISKDVDVQVADGVTMHMDPTMAQAVMQNLIENAIKYAAQADAPRVRVYGENRDDQEWIVVEDNGAGFDMQGGDPFEAFQRLHGAEYPGTGIGLTTVKRIIDRHGGQIEAEGEPGEGARLRFTVPAG